MAARVLISAGEASGDLYAAALAGKLRRDHPGIELFGCAGPRMRAAGVEPVVESESLAVVGLIEVIGHIPRIYREYRKLVEEAARRRPDVAILTDSPDFHFRVAKKLKRLGIPVVYLIAPQVWAWRKRRLPTMRKNIDRLLCIFPFEKDFFEKNGIATEYLGHPLTRMVRASAPRTELRRRFGVPDGVRLIAVLPGSREGEIERHLPVLIEAVKLIQRKRGLCPEGAHCFTASLPPRMAEKFRERFLAASIQVQEGQTWDVLACSDLALAASGTVTIEACLLNTPMVTFYRVNGLSWLLGKLLVRVPFYSMVNLVAGRRIVPELIQSEMTAERLAAEAFSLLEDPLEANAIRRQMRADLAEVAGKLSGPHDPMETAASVVTELLEKEMVHAS